ncbi:hypothetical protein J6590_048349 [Homalodisca vitripennis]|nr:hypothetical protein J6590_048349 [Homalodisca vitripennis]
MGLARVLANPITQEDISRCFIRRHPVGGGLRSFEWTITISSEWWDRKRLLMVIVPLDLYQTALWRQHKVILKLILLHFRRRLSESLSSLLPLEDYPDIVNSARSKLAEVNVSVTECFIFDTLVGLWEVLGISTRPGFSADGIGMDHHVAVISAQSTEDPPLLSCP